MDLRNSKPFKSNAKDPLHGLTPIWDVILKCITILIAITATTTVALQISKDGLSCVAFNVRYSDATSMANETYEPTDKKVLAAFTNSECFQSMDTFLAFFAFFIVIESVAIIFVNHVFLWIPQCSHTLYQFVSIVQKCYECTGTSEQISSVLQSIDGNVDSRSESSSLLPSNAQGSTKSVQTLQSSTAHKEDHQLDNKSKAKIETIYDNVKTFSDKQSKSNRLVIFYGIRLFLLIVLPCVFMVTNHRAFIFRSSFKCVLQNLPEPLPITYDLILCSRYVTSYFIAASWMFFGCLAACFFVSFVIVLIVVISIFRDKCACKTFCNTKKIPDDCKCSMFFLCFMLRRNSHLEFERFILFYSKGNV